jgi:hypothetical protein
MKILEDYADTLEQASMDEAIQYLDKALQVDPNNTDALDMKNTALNELDR